MLSFQVNAFSYKVDLYLYFTWSEGRKEESKMNGSKQVGRESDLAYISAFQDTSLYVRCHSWTVRLSHSLSLSLSSSLCVSLAIAIDQKLPSTASASAFAAPCLSIAVYNLVCTHKSPCATATKDEMTRKEERERERWTTVSHCTECHSAVSETVHWVRGRRSTLLKENELEWQNVSFEKVKWPVLRFSSSLEQFSKLKSAPIAHKIFCQLITQYHVNGHFVRLVFFFSTSLATIFIFLAHWYWDKRKNSLHTCLSLWPLMVVSSFLSFLSFFRPFSPQTLSFTHQLHSLRPLFTVHIAWLSSSHESPLLPHGVLLCLFFSLFSLFSPCKACLWVTHLYRWSRFSVENTFVFTFTASATFTC